MSGSVFDSIKWPNNERWDKIRTSTEFNIPKTIKYSYMQYMTFTCKILTPMFLGESIKGSVELRPPALKASMRFWWRALHAHLDLQDLKDKESEIFGGGGEYSKRSIIEFFDFSTELHEGNNPKLPHKYNGEGSAFAKSFVVNQNFYLKIRITNETIFTYTQLKSLMIIISTIGNLGARSRRGMGGWKIIKIDEVDLNIQFSDLIKSINVFSTNYTYDNINSKILLIDKPNLKTINYSFIKSIYQSKNKFRDCNIFLKKIMNESSNYKNLNLNKYKRLIGDMNPRFASPIYATLLENNNIYTPIITKLNNHMKTNDDDNEFIDNYIQKIVSLIQ